MCEAEGEVSLISYQTTKFCDVYSGACARDAEALQGEKKDVFKCFVSSHHQLQLTGVIFSADVVIGRQIQVSHSVHLLFITLLHLYCIC